jgi:hypothetical protein
MTGPVEAAEWRACVRKYCQLSKASGRQAHFLNFMYRGRRNGVCNFSMFSASSPAKNRVISTMNKQIVSCDNYVYGDLYCSSRCCSRTFSSCNARTVSSSPRSSSKWIGATYLFSAAQVGFQRGMYRMSSASSACKTYLDVPESHSGW